MRKLIKIRIPVAVDPKGRWVAYGYKGVKSHEEAMDAFDYDTVGPNEAFYWVTAEVAVPETEEVKASHVEPVGTMESKS